MNMATRAQILDEAVYISHCKGKVFTRLFSLKLWINNYADGPLWFWWGNQSKKNSKFKPVKLLATVVEGDQKAPFSIATTPRPSWWALLFSLDCSTLPLISTSYCWVLSREVSNTIFKVFGMTRPEIEPRPRRPQVNTLPHQTNELDKPIKL